MALKFDVPDYKKVRVIVDTDAACEADDSFAIAHALMSPKLIVKGILAEHFNCEGSVERSYREIETILQAMELSVPFYMGAEGAMKENDGSMNEASRFLIDEAMREDEKPLFVLCQGAITNVAIAMRKEPKIIQRMTVVWIGTHGIASGGKQIKRALFREFNAGNDIAAANYVLQSGVRLWLIPSFVYTTIRIGIAEIQRRIAPCGNIGRHLFEQLTAYNMSEGAGWTQGESWSLGDSPAIAVAINPDCGTYEEVKAPVILEDTSSAKGENMPTIRMYTQVDSRYILEDFIAKLELMYG